MLPLLALVLVTHNAAPLLPAFAQSWQASLQNVSPLVSQIETHIADSSSTDNTLSLAESLFPAATLHRLENRGFGAAANHAIRACQSPWILLCNPDLTFPPDFAQILLVPLLQNTLPLPDSLPKSKLA